LTKIKLTIISSPIIFISHGRTSGIVHICICLVMRRLVIVVVVVVGVGPIQVQNHIV
jgi:hypothetical protein